MKQMAKMFRNKLLGRVLPNPRNNWRLARLKNKHAGKRAFIIGNGPSLKVGDLDHLKSEITYASNKIYLAYDQTDWRPTYLTCTDEIVAVNNHDMLLKQNGVKLFGHSVFKYFNKDKNITFCNPPISPEAALEWDLIKGISTGHSVVYYDLQLAYWMGIREVYVIGLDFSFDVRSVPTGEESMGNTVIKATDEKNHFHPDYRKPGETWTMPKLDKLREEFAYAGEVFKESGGMIYNASRSTKLDVWPLVNFDDVVH